MKVLIDVFHKKVELKEKDVTFILLYAEVNKDLYKSLKGEINFDWLLKDVMRYLHNVSVNTKMSHDEIQDLWFTLYHDILKTLSF